jgi:hypothetical protein
MRQFRVPYTTIDRHSADVIKRNQNATVTKGEIVFDLTDGQYEILQNALARGWIQVSKRASDQIILTAYWLWCLSMNRPWVKVTTGRGKLWQCDLDMITSPFNLSETGMDLVTDLFRETAHLKARRSRDRIADVGNWSVCNCIPPERVAYVASMLFAIANYERIPIAPAGAGESPGVQVA